MNQQNNDDTDDSVDSYFDDDDLEYSRDLDQVRVISRFIDALSQFSLFHYPCTIKNYPKQVLGSCPCSKSYVSCKSIFHHKMKRMSQMN